MARISICIMERIQILVYDRDSLVVFEAHMAVLNFDFVWL